MVTEKQKRMEDLLGLSKRTKRVISSPMRYPGSKYSSLSKILPELPYKKGYVEVFGGSAVILLNRKQSTSEVYNDRFSGVVAFFKALRDHPFELTTRLEYMFHSREEWERCKATWFDSKLDLIERAARWYYMTQYSFLGKGDAWATIRKPSQPIGGSIQNKLPLLKRIAYRFKKVQIENLCWQDMFKMYDDPETVFYLDPPYFNADTTSYKFLMSRKDHENMLNEVFKMKAFVAVSGYPNDLYDDYPWTRKKIWSRKDKASSMQRLNDRRGEKWGTKQEVLWMKESQ